MDVDKLHEMQAPAYGAEAVFSASVLAFSALLLPMLRMRAPYSAVLKRSRVGSTNETVSCSGLVAASMPNQVLSMLAREKRILPEACAFAVVCQRLLSAASPSSWKFSLGSCNKLSKASTWLEVRVCESVG